jgi:asparagine synthase (glutamine-hydrolysing)
MNELLPPGGPEGDCLSETKALLPLLPAIETDQEALRDYLTFQFTLAGKTLFVGVNELLPDYYLTIRNRGLHVRRYWDVTYEPDLDHPQSYPTR